MSVRWIEGIAMMRLRAASMAGILALALTGCVTRTHIENAALREPWPGGPIGLTADADLTTRGPPPSVGGDILKGTSSEALAAERLKASKALTDALAQP